MKRILILAAALSLVVAGIAFAGVQGTPHDLSSGAGEICVACHTPHMAVASTSGPLWNRSAPAATYTYYTSATFDMSLPALVLGPQSLACMTCHNGLGSTVVNSPGPANPNPVPYTLAAAAGTSILPGGYTDSFSNLTEDLRDDHPVGFEYVNTEDTTNSFPAAAGNMIAGTYPVYGANLKFECATCHDVHSTTVPTQSPVYFLRRDNAGSAMCGDCHVLKF